MNPSDRGASTAELAVVMPVVMTMILLVIHFGVWYHGVHVADTIVAQAADAARIDGGNAGDGQAKASLLLGRLGHAVLLNPRVEVTRGDETARAELHAATPRVVPFLTLTVHAVSVRPIEKFRPR